MSSFDSAPVPGVVDGDEDAGVEYAVAAVVRSWVHSYVVDTRMGEGKDSKLEFHSLSFALVAK